MGGRVRPRRYHARDLIPRMAGYARIRSVRWRTGETDVVRSAQRVRGSSLTGRGKDAPSSRAALSSAMWRGMMLDGDSLGGRISHDALRHPSSAQEPESLVTDVQPGGWVVAAGPFRLPGKTHICMSGKKSV